MEESDQTRRARLAEGIARKRRLMSAMRIVPQDKLLSEARERHANFIQKMTEELHEMEVEFHELNVRQIRREMRGADR